MDSEWFSEWKDFQERKNEFKLLLCPKCGEPLKVYKGKKYCWEEYQVCEKCKIASDDTR